jgi:hypothetical protein
MPVVYRVQCESCGKSPPLPDLDSAHSSVEIGKVLSDSYAALKLSDGTFLPLPHPAESVILEKKGLTATQAIRQKRLYHVTYKVCKQCGSIHLEYQLQQFTDGCMIVLATIPITVAVLKFGFRQDWAVSLTRTLLAMFLFGVCLSLFNQVRWRRQICQTKLHACPKCNTHGLVRISELNGKTIVCPHCQSQSMRFHILGIS